VGDAPDDPVELPRDEVPLLTGDRFVQLLDEGRLADPRIPGHQHHGGGAPAGAVEGAQQLLDLLVASVQLLRDEEPVRHITLPEGEGRDAPALGALPGAGFEVGLQAQGALVSLLGGLREQLHDDLRERCRDVGVDVGGGGRGLRDVPVDQLQGIARLERAHPGRQLVERDAEGVEVGTVIDGSVHPSRLLGGQVGERVAEDVRWERRQALAGRLRGEAEIGEPHLVGRGVDQDAPGIDVLVDDVATMELGEDRRELDRDPEEAVDVERTRARERREGRSTPVLEHEARAVIVALQRVGPRNPGEGKPVEEPVLALEPLEIVRARRMSARNLQEHRRSVGPTMTTVERVPRVPRKLLEDLVAGDGHGRRARSPERSFYAATHRRRPADGDPTGGGPRRNTPGVPRTGRHRRHRRRATQVSIACSRPDSRAVARMASVGAPSCASSKSSSVAELTRHSATTGPAPP
jgi:hypothetical protein